MMPGDERVGPAGCGWVRARMEPFIDGDLSRDESEQIETHVERCSACRHELLLASRIAAGLRELPRKRCPESGIQMPADSAVGRRQREGARRRLPQGGSYGWIHRVGRLWRQPALATGFLIVLVAGSLLVAQLRHSSTDVDEETVLEAEAAVKWTLAYIDEVGRQAGMTFRDDILDARILAPAERAVVSKLGGRSHSLPADNGGSR